MWNETSVMKTGLVAAVALIIIRILLERTGAPFLLASVFGVVWLYFLLPAAFAVSIRKAALSWPFLRLMKDVVLFAVYTRIMVAMTYILAHKLNWPAARFSAAHGGTVGPAIQSWQGLLFIVTRNGTIWVVMAAIIGAVIGGITLLIKRKSPAGR
jgi:hypothetical protein